MIWLISILLLCQGLFADDLTVDPPDIWHTRCTECLPPRVSEVEEAFHINLIDPVYRGGVLISEKGGTLTAPGLKVQARRITHIKQLDANPPTYSLYCEGGVIIQYGEHLLVGETLCYDFLTDTGKLTCPRIADPPWYIGGQEVELLGNGTILIRRGSISTSEARVCKDLELMATRIHVDQNRMIKASNIQPRVYGLPFFWFPCFKFDAKHIGHSPIGIRYGWGGFAGEYVSLRYRFFTLNALRAYLRLDGFFKHGVGGGIETAYAPGHRPTEIYTRSYYATDLPLDTRIARNRYRFQGTFYDKLRDGTTIKGGYDVVSDAQMASDYNTNDFQLKTAKRTQVAIRKQREAWLASLYARVRVNDFQTVNQALPSVYFNSHPYRTRFAGIYADTSIRASYYDYVFSNNLALSEQNFDSARVAIRPRIYRPFCWRGVKLTPEVSFIGIGYSDSPKDPFETNSSGDAIGQAIGSFQMHLESTLTRTFGRCTHLLQPYVHYQFLTDPTASPGRSYIFNIDDGWARINYARFGMRNTFFSAACRRPVFFDLWTLVFFQTESLPNSVPWIFAKTILSPTNRLDVSGEATWQVQKGLLNELNARADLTLTENLALGAEYRQRSRYEWRKADHLNYIVDMTLDEQELLDSVLSDARKTVLGRIFYRVNPDLSLEGKVRYGWDRSTSLDYVEYELKAATMIFDHWRLLYTFEKRESDVRNSLTLKLQPGPA